MAIKTLTRKSAFFLPFKIHTKYFTLPKGRDIIATINGVGSIKIVDQVKAYNPSHLVTANDVRALAGVISMEQNVSKGVITTTSDFAPKVREDELIKSLIPYRLELRPKKELLPWLQDIVKKAKQHKS